MLSAMQYFVDKFFLFSAILTMAYFGTLSGVGVKSNLEPKEVIPEWSRPLYIVAAMY